eukprot:Gb_28484 [translate_table: standard]
MEMTGFQPEPFLSVDVICLSTSSWYLRRPHDRSRAFGPEVCVSGGYEIKIWWLGLNLCLKERVPPHPPITDPFRIWTWLVIIKFAFSSHPLHSCDVRDGIAFFI